MGKGGLELLLGVLDMDQREVKATEVSLEIAYFGPDLGELLMKFGEVAVEIAFGLRELGPQVDEVEQERFMTHDKGAQGGIDGCDACV